MIEEDQKDKLIDMMLSSAGLSAITINRLTGSDEQAGVSDADLYLAIASKAKEVLEDELVEKGQQTLACQAVVLDTIFNSLAVTASKQDNFKNYDMVMKLALKAQAQSRCTIEAISKIKNPPNATFVKQANISNGHQQVNNWNGTTNHQEASHERVTEKEPNELLEEQYGERLDFGATSEASRANTTVETVGEVDRAGKCRGKA